MSFFDDGEILLLELLGKARFSSSQIMRDLWNAPRSNAEANKGRESWTHMKLFENGEGFQEAQD